VIPRQLRRSNPVTLTFPDELERPGLLTRTLDFEENVLFHAVPIRLHVLSRAEEQRIKRFTGQAFVVLINSVVEILESIFRASFPDDAAARASVFPRSRAPTELRLEPGQPVKGAVVARRRTGSSPGRRMVREILR
jgi:hypothetical protein